MNTASFRRSTLLLFLVSIAPMFEASGALGGHGQIIPNGDLVTPKHGAVEQLPIWVMSDKKKESYTPPDTHYLGPNEIYVQRAMNLFNAAPEGFYVTVGTDRAFNNFSLAKKATDLMIVDIDPLAVFWGELNTWALKVSKDQKDYRHLRRGATDAEWLARAKDVPFPVKALQLFQSLGPQKIKKIFKEPEADELIDLISKFPQGMKIFPENDAYGNFVKWARKQFPGSGGMGDFSIFERQPSSNDPQTRELVNANYMFNKPQFEKLQKAARDGRIHCRLADLSDKPAMEQIAKAIDDEGKQLSLLDVSNCWHIHHAMRMGIQSTIDAFQSVAKRDSIFMLTDGIGTDFNYAGFTFDHMAKHQKDKKDGPDDIFDKGYAKANGITWPPLGFFNYSKEKFAYPALSKEGHPADLQD